MRLFPAFFLPLLLGACASPPVYLDRPADPSVKGPRLGYQSVAGETKTFRPVGPKSWEELNKRVAPKT